MKVEVTVMEAGAIDTAIKLLRKNNKIHTADLLKGLLEKIRAEFHNQDQK